MQIDHDSGHSRFSTTIDGHEAGLDYRREDDVLVITHTRVPEAIGGRGVAGALVREAVEFARTQGLRVRPACTYAAAWMQRHSEYQDLLA